jgi:hypothetical protein
MRRSFNLPGAEENMLRNAKLFARERLPAGMHAGAASIGILALFLSGACFSPVFDAGCTIKCDPANRRCPGDLQCIQNDRDEPVCAAPGATACRPSDAPPPNVLCREGSCITLPVAIRDGLVLLLWPTALPLPDMPVPVWPDLSGHRNDARATLITDPPVAIAAGGVRFSAKLGAGLEVLDAPSLSFQADDLAVIVVAGIDKATPVTLLRKSDQDASMPRQVSLDWAFVSDLHAQRAQAAFNATVVTSSLDMVPPVRAVYVVWRRSEHLELRIDGSVFGTADLPAASDSVTASENLFIGIPSEFGLPIDTVNAVLVVRGLIDIQDLVALEDFLRPFTQAPP